MSVRHITELDCDLCGWTFQCRSASSARALDGWHRQQQADGCYLDICGRCWSDLHPSSEEDIDRG